MAPCLPLHLLLLLVLIHFQSCMARAFETRLQSDAYHWRIIQMAEEEAGRKGRGESMISGGDSGAA